jgi:hypothetical protein
MEGKFENADKKLYREVMGVREGIRGSGRNSIREIFV